MNQASARPQPDAPRWLLIVALVAGALGIGGRLTALGDKPFWQDEVFSSSVVNGLSIGDAVHQKFPSGVVTAGQLVDLMERPVSAGPMDLLRYMRDNDAHHPPAYYLALQAWSRMTHFSPAQARLFSALGGIALIFAFFWLGCDLMGRSGGLIAFSLAALSPLHLAYAQEAREYAFWALALCVLFRCFVRALRSDTSDDWFNYGVAATVALYTAELSFAVVVAQAVAAACLKDRRHWRAALAFAVPIAFFSPWILVILHGVRQIQRGTTWLSDPYAPSVYVRQLISLPTALIASFPGLFNKPLLSFVAAGAVSLSILGIAGAFAARSDRAARAMILSAFASVLVPFLLADMVLGGHRALLSRYEFPMYVALTAALGAGIAALRGPALPIALSVALLLSASTDIRYFRSPSWWTKGTLAGDRVLLRTLRAEPPVIITSNHGPLATALATQLDPDTIFVLQNTDFSVQPPARTGRPHFVLWSAPWLESWARAQGAEAVQGTRRLYRLPIDRPS